MKELKSLDVNLIHPTRIVRNKNLWNTGMEICFSILWLNSTGPTYTLPQSHILLRGMSSEYVDIWTEVVRALVQDASVG